MIGQIIFMKAVINADDGGEIYSWKYMFYLICAIRWVNFSIYIFFKVFWHGIMVLIKNQLYLLERVVKSYEAIV